MITFPCRPVNQGDSGWTAVPMGTPVEATPCRCGDRQLVIDDTCHTCGHYPAETIRATWLRRAVYLARTRTTRPAQVPVAA